MHLALSRSRSIKVGLILAALSITASVLLFQGTLDDFTPYHVATVEETLANGGLVEKLDQVIQVPGFYILGAQISLVTGIDPFQLLYYPIQAVPFAAALFGLIFVLSRSHALAGLVVFIELISGTDGTGKIFFWPHGVGYILFFSILLLVLIMLGEKRRSGGEWRFHVLAVIMGTSLVYISYNLTAMALLFIGAILALLVLLRKRVTVGDDHGRSQGQVRSSMFTLFMVMTVVVLGLSRFVYGVFIPTLRVAQDFQMSSLDKLIISFFSSDQAANPLSAIMVSYSPSVSAVSGVKYGVLAVTILIFCVVILNKLLKRETLSGPQVFLVAALLMSMAYAVPRLMVGAIIVSALWLPAMLMIVHFSRMRRWFRVWAAVALVIILSCTALYIGAMESAGHFNRDQFQYASYEAPALWYAEHNDGRVAASDVLTNDFFILYSLERSVEYNTSSTVDAIWEQHKTLTQQEAMALVRISNEELGPKYYVLNERLTRMSLQNWVIVESWSGSAGQIASNDQIDKIYDAPLISMYTTQR